VWVGVTHVGPSNCVLDGVEIHPWEEAIFGIRPIEKHWESLLQCMQQKSFSRQ